jgi:diguanylate cyclase (GGDEF)-like protein
MDELYDLPFNRAPHPSYQEPIPAFETVKHSIVLMRGCFGGCTFCSITEHEGRVIQNRSAESVLREVRALRRMDDFRGVISDIGGPTANMYKMRCKSDAIESACRRLSCVHPGVCENLQTDHGPLLEVMRRTRAADGVRRVFVASGVRTDLAERSPEYVADLAAHHVGGQLSVAPEHVSPRVLSKMKKPGIASYERFQQMFACASEDAGKEQYDIPYFISGHPGSTLEDMVELALWLKKNGRRPRQVQDFIPTPMSLAATMYWTGIDPLAMKPVYTARGLKEKRMQKSLLMYWKREEHPAVREALAAARREDLIGYGPDCLVPPAGGGYAGGVSEWDEDTPVFDLEPPRLVANVSPAERPYLIVLVGTHVGEMVKLDEGVTMLGRGEGSAIHVFDDSASRRHAIVRVTAGDTTLEDLGSRNGTWVNGARVSIHRLRDGDKIQIGSTTILKFTYHDHLEESFQRNMFESALRDGLTRAFNKRYFLERLESEVRFARRHSEPLSLVLLDIDHFKKVNDSYGHVTGDHVIASLARKIHEVIRNEDVFARYGGEEFAVLLRSIELTKAMAFADRLRRTIEAFEHTAGAARFRVTVSCGVAAMPLVASDEPLALIAAADEALYAAKNAGRNCIRGMIGAPGRT